MKVTVELHLHRKILEALVHEQGGLDIGTIAVMVLNTCAAQLGILDAILAKDNASFVAVARPAARLGNL